MTLTNDSIVSSIREKMGIQENRASQLLESVLETMRSALANGEHVDISDFGKLSVYTRQSKKKDSTSVKHKTVSFTCSPTLRRKLNGAEWIQCPKCQSRGIKRYEYYNVFSLLQNILNMKFGVPPELLLKYRYDLILLCPVCEGKGMIDWVRNSRVGGVEPFGDLNGCLDLFIRSVWKRPVQGWMGHGKKGLVFLHGISPWNRPKKRNEESDLEQVVEASRQRYMGPFKLNKNILALDTADLTKILETLIKLTMISAPDLSREQIRSVLSSAGLDEYLPDVYAFPIEDDLQPK